ncbi:unnamed protein product [Spodoptera exigua]|nr:unnamed protein product [Spodoptera exigua]
MEKPKCDVISFLVTHLHRKTFPVEVLVDICLEKFSHEDIIFTRNIVTDAFGEKIDYSKPRSAETSNIRQDLYRIIFYLRLVPCVENKLNDYTDAIEETALLARLDGMSQLVSDLRGVLSIPSENMQSKDSPSKPGPSKNAKSDNKDARSDATAEQEMQPSGSSETEMYALYCDNIHSYTQCTPAGYHDDNMDLESSKTRQNRRVKLPQMEEKEIKPEDNSGCLPPPPVPLADGLRINPVESANETFNLITAIAPSLSVSTLRVNPPLVVDVTSQPQVQMPVAQSPPAITTHPVRRNSDEEQPMYNFDALAERAFHQLFRQDSVSTDSSSSDRNSSDNNSSSGLSSSGLSTSGLSSSGPSSSDPVEEGLSSISNDSSNLTISSGNSSLNEEAQVLLNSFAPTNGPRLIAPGVAAPRPTGAPVHEFIRPADLWGPPLTQSENPPQETVAAQPQSGADDDSTDSLQEMQPSSPKRRRPME